MASRMNLFSMRAISHLWGCKGKIVRVYYSVERSRSLEGLLLGTYAENCREFR